ncbi:MAG: hypothetical protein KF819_14140 [Labilithrix sp.]|nr:hypothetical protein [Labilithrix sp.]
MEPLAGDARVAVLGNGELALRLLVSRLLELGARTVHVYDPDPDRVARIADEVPRGVSARMLREDFDVRDGAFDLVIIPDIAGLPDPGAAIVRLRRVVDARGTVVAMGRARTQAASTEVAFPDIAPAVVGYAELYDWFALQFENVTMTGVVPFEGVVFAELGAGDDVAVSVDTSLADSKAADVFVVIAGREDTMLDPYAIVQVPSAEEEAEEDEAFETRDTTIPASVIRADESQVAREAEAAAAFAQIQLKAEMLESQLDDHRHKLAGAEARAAEQAGRVEQLVLERDVALTRATELEGILGAAQQALGSLERRVVVAEQGMLERDDQIAALNAELDARAAAGERIAVAAVIDPSVVNELVARAERAEASLTLHIADLAQVSEAHASETANLEAQLQERARVIAAMDRELARREQLVRELVGSLEEARDGQANGFEVASPLPMPGHAPQDVARLRRKLDELALEVARREGELVAQAWKIAELEQRPTTTSSTVELGRGDVERDLARARDELDALRQALTQEHAARVAAESGEELTRARAELARQAVLLEQKRIFPGG